MVAGNDRKGVVPGVGLAVGWARLGATAFAENYIVREGQTIAEIVVPEVPCNSVRFAARELQAYVKDISRAVLGDPPQATSIENHWRRWLDPGVNEERRGQVDGLGQTPDHRFPAMVCPPMRPPAATYLSQLQVYPTCRRRQIFAAKTPQNGPAGAMEGTVHKEGKTMLIYPVARMAIWGEKMDLTGMVESGRLG